MSADILRDELLAVEGIASAEVDGDVDSPAGVRIRLAPGADADRVGDRVQQILARHGMRSRVGGSGPTVGPVPGPAGGPRASVSPPPPPGAPGSVVALRAAPDFEEEPTVDEHPDHPAGRRRQEPADDTTQPPDDDGDDAPAAGESDSSADAEDEDRPASPVTTGALGTLSVEEGRSGVVVTAVARDGRRAARRSRTTTSGLDEAIVGAVAELVLGDLAPPPLLVSVTDMPIDETVVVTVLLEVEDGVRCAGSSVLEGGRAFAVARAAWAALSQGL